jgi:class 3 adenylate cyclase/ActR/RegA family two-component response regulator
VTDPLPPDDPSGLGDFGEIRRRLAAALRDELRPEVDRLVRGLGPETPDEPRHCLTQVGTATARLGGLIEELGGPSGGGEPEAFRSVVRHNLLNPVGQVAGYAELLLDGEGDWLDRHAAELEALRVAAGRMKTLIQTLLASVRTAEPAAPVVPAAPLREPVAALAEGERGRILVVDDQESNRDLLGRWLRRLGQEYATAENGRQALERLAREPFDLVLLDILMPELNGVQVLERLKADERLRHIPVIMISALSELDSVVRCIEMGAEDYLPKPFQPVLLRARIGACLEKKRLRDREVDYLEQIDRQRQRYDELLRAILPPAVVDELARNRPVPPKRYERTAVLFADIEGFTGYCERHPPEEVVAHLKDLVEACEEICGRHGVQKIKTIGDSFMAAAGLLVPVEKPVLASVCCGLEMIAAARRLPPHWNLRVGIHAGSLVAGLLGSRQYLYDLWGATVNTAARVEAHGAAGSVTLSRSAWEQVAAVARGESRGTVEVKGIGPLEMVRFIDFTDPGVVCGEKRSAEGRR